MSRDDALIDEMMNTANAVKVHLIGENQYALKNASLSLLHQKLFKCDERALTDKITIFDMPYIFLFKITLSLHAPTTNMVSDVLLSFDFWYLEYKLG